MAIPRFTTFADLEALRSLYDQMPPDTQAAALRDWSEAWAFLATETDLVFDAPEEDVLARLLDDAMIRSLYQATTVDRFGTDTAPAPRHPWQLHFVTQPRRHRGVVSLSAEQMQREIPRLRVNQGIRLHEGAGLSEQLTALRPFCTSACGIIVVDPYLLSAGRTGLRESVAPLLASLVSPDAESVPVLVVCGTVSRDRGRPQPGLCPNLVREFDGNAERARGILEAELGQRHGGKVRVSLVVHGQAMNRYHDRHLFTQYVEVHASRSVDQLASRGVVKHDASFAGFSALNLDQRLTTIRRLQKVKDLVDDARGRSDARVAGRLDHPLFALLET